MSTAGKVLTVLILLVMITWIVMLSAVTQLNVNWQQKIAAQDEQLKKATDDLEKASRSYIDLTESTRVEQANKDPRPPRDLHPDRRRRGPSIEVDRVPGQRQVPARRLRDRGEAGRDQQRYPQGREGQGHRRPRPEARRHRQGQAVNAELRDQLAKLQDEFKQLLADNKTLADKAAQGRTAPKPTYTGRTSPSS